MQSLRGDPVISRSCFTSFELFDAPGAAAKARVAIAANAEFLVVRVAATLNLWMPSASIFI